MTNTAATIERDRAVQIAGAEEPVSELELKVVELLNVAVPEQTCLMCGQDVENHADGCGVFALEQWLNPTPRRVDKFGSLQGFFEGFWIETPSVVLCG